MRTKTRFAMYPAWAYEREIADDNELSRQGWQLTRMGLFYDKYAFDGSVVYRYALDFDQDIDDPVRYRETFQEQGWEYINSTFNGWHIFRKKYDPALPDEAYQIYTDEQSRQAMHGRWRRLLTVLGIIELVCGLVNMALNIGDFSPGSFLLGLGSVILGAVILTGARKTGRESRFWNSGWALAIVLIVLAIWIAEFLQGPSLSNLALALWGVYATLLWVNRRRVLQKAGTDAARRRGPVWPFAAVTLLWLGVIFAAAVLPNRSVEDCRYDGLLADAPAVMEMDITYPSWYTLDIFAYNGGSGVYTLENSRGDTVSQGVLPLDESAEKNVRKVFLWPGTYTLAVDGTAGAVPGTENVPAGGLYYRLHEGW